MSTIADFLVAADDFVLPSAVVGAEATHVAVERTVSHPEAAVAPYVRVAGDDFATFETALAADATASAFDVSPIADDQRRYRVEWADLSDSVIPIVDAVGGAIVRAEYTGPRWALRIRFHDRDALSTFCRRCRRKFSVTLSRAITTANADPMDLYGVTAEQREALLAALDCGYFEVPRATTQETLAGQLGISSQSLSQRLRRGQRNLLVHTISTDRSDI